MLVAILCHGSRASAAVIHVPSEVPTIDAALSAAERGDSILVAPGTYLERLLIPDKDLSVIGVQGADVTVLDGSRQPDSSLVSIRSNGHLSCRFQGFTVTGVRGKTAVAIYRANVQVDQCIIRDNAAIGIFSVATNLTLTQCSLLRNEAWKGYPSFGGALSITTYVDGPTLATDVHGCRIEGNHAGFGGALSGGATALSFKDNVVSGNSSVYDGGALFLWPMVANSEIANCTFADNVGGDHGGAIAAWHYIGGFLNIHHNLFLKNISRADDSQAVNGAGGALHVSGHAGAIRNNTFAYNRSAFPGRGGGICVDFTSVAYPIEWTIERNVIFGSTGAALTCTGIGGSLTITNNILYHNDEDFTAEITCTPKVYSDNVNVDPYFCSPEADDFHVAANSPAILGAATIGAFEAPGCAAVPVVPTTWGAIKAMFGNSRDH